MPTKCLPRCILFNEYNKSINLKELNFYKVCFLTTMNCIRNQKTDLWKIPHIWKVNNTQASKKKLKGKLKSILSWIKLKILHNKIGRMLIKQCLEEDLLSPICQYRGKKRTFPNK